MRNRGKLKFGYLHIPNGSAQSPRCDMNDRIRAFLKRLPNLAEFARKVDVPYWVLYYHATHDEAAMNADHAMLIAAEMERGEG